MSYDDIEIGDAFEFVYYDKESVSKEEILWSSIERKWISCWGLHVLIAKSEDVVTFANQKGCFHARVDHTTGDRFELPNPLLLPRAIK
jgi:hypothetical protein